VLRIAREAGAFVIEDDFARHLGHAGAAPLPPPLAAADADGVVVHIRSLTKVTAPSMRIAALTARGPAFDRLRNVQVIDSFFVPRPLQEAALDLIGSPLWRTHLRTVAGALRTAGPPLSAPFSTGSPGSLLRFRTAATTSGSACGTEPTRTPSRREPCGPR
jgi:DNA-binding transcriptional MocR family regulator